MATKKIVPRADTEGQIGTAAKRWGQSHFHNKVTVSGDILTTNKRTIYVDAGSMVPTVTNGASAGTQELATNDVMIDYFAFDTSTSEKVQFKLVMPEMWDAGTIKAKFYWKTSGTDTGTLHWYIQAVAHSDSGALDTAFGTAVTTSAQDAGNGTLNDLHITEPTTAVTVAGSAERPDLVLFQIYRNVATDTYSEDAHLLGVVIEYSESVTAHTGF